MTACASVPTPEGPVALSPGQRVRVTLSSRAALGALQGNVQSVSVDSLVVEREEGGVRRLSRSQIDDIRVSVARERSFGRGAGLGLITVAPWIAAAGVAILLFPPDMGPDETFVKVIGGVVAVGAVLGGITRQDVWVDALWPTVKPLPPDSLAVEDP